MSDWGLSSASRGAYSQTRGKQPTLALLRFLVEQRGQQFDPQTLYQFKATAQQNGDSAMVRYIDSILPPEWRSQEFVYVDPELMREFGNALAEDDIPKVDRLLKEHPGQINLYEFTGDIGLSNSPQLLAHLINKHGFDPQPSSLAEIRQSAIMEEKFDIVDYIDEFLDPLKFPLIKDDGNEFSVVQFIVNDRQFVVEESGKRPVDLSKRYPKYKWYWAAFKLAKKFESRGYHWL